MAQAVLYDGQSAARQVVEVLLEADRQTLVVRREGAALVWPLAELRRVEAGAGALVLARRDAGDAHDARAAARLVVTDPALIAQIRAAAPALDRRDVRPGTARRVVLSLAGAGAGAAVAFLLFVFLPFVSDRLAEGLPLETEQRFGRAVVVQIEEVLGSGDGGLVCDAPEGVAALDRLTARLTEGQGLAYPVTIRVLDHDMVNAFAAPGGQVVVLRGLVDAAQSPDEVAGVIAHEIGHVEARDPTRLAFRAAGSAGILSLLLGDVTGGAVVAFAGEYLLSASYTREAEAAADVFAHALMARAGVSTAGLADFFDRIDGMDGDLPDYLSTHPAPAGRAAAARAADGGATGPALSATDWQALRAICG